MGFRFPAGPLPPGTIFADPEKPSRELARVTSSVESPRFGPIGLGMAFRDVEEGASLPLPGQTAAAGGVVVCGLPFA